MIFFENKTLVYAIAMSYLWEKYYKKNRYVTEVEWKEKSPIYTCLLQPMPMKHIKS